jgi:predicted nucleic acid-binding Zn ribbon protein
MSVDIVELVARVVNGAIDEYSYEFQQRQELLKRKKRKRRRIIFLVLFLLIVIGISVFYLLGR